VPHQAPVARLRGFEESRTLTSVSRERVVVIGAGLTGLAVAARLLAAGRDVLVLEASRRPGGQIHTWREAGVTVELGAEGFVARSRAVPALCALLGIESALIDQLTTDTYSLENGAFVLLPPGEAARRLGFQVPAEELGRGIRSLARGMGQLTDALVARVTPTRLRTGAVVSDISGARQIRLADGSSEVASEIVLAAPARHAAALLAPLGLAETPPLDEAPLMSNVSVNLLYRAEQFADYPAGSGLLFPDSFASVGLRALSLVDHKFGGRVPASHHLLRVFFRPVGDALTTFTDERFGAEAARAVQQVLAVSGEPERAWVSRWADALPVFSPTYKAQAAAADEALQTLGIHVAGSAFHGAGIDGAVASAEIVAARLSPS
jgi:protoporphyrinogen/coproporphyrinogen III oxidase